MPTQWIDVVDSAVKIGLGALISGIATYSVSAQSHKKDVHKNITNKKINMLEEISENAEEYFYFCTLLSNVVQGMQHSARNIGERLTDAQIEKLKSTQKDIQEILASRNKAMSKIKILSIDAAEVAITQHNNILSDYRAIFVFNKKMPTKDETENFDLQRKKYVDDFYKAIGRYMDTITT